MDAKKIAGLIVSGEGPKEEAVNEVELIAQDIIDAVAAKDAKILASALKAAFLAMESEPHEEYEEEMEG